jgi:DNA repair protein RecN (Recombination protein N)
LLQLLKVLNFALIEQAEIEFDNGFNVLTGETGAGKSMVVDALSVVLGGRSSVEMVRSGCDQFRIDAVFELRQQGALQALLTEQAIPLEIDGLLFLSRTVSRQGKNTVLVNGTPSPLSLLRMIGELLLDMHGQHENQALLRPESYLGLLDGADAAITPLLTDYQVGFDEWRSTQEKIAGIDRDERQRAQRLDMLQWQIDEIAAARLKETEETELPAQVSLLAHAEKISAAVGAAWAGLSDGDEREKGAITILQECRRQLDNAARFDASLSQYAGQIAQIVVQLDDLAPELRDYLDQVEYDPAKLSRLQDRLDLIQRLKQKYGGSVAEVLDYAQRASAEVAELSCHDEILQDLRKQLQRQEEQLQAKASALSDQRNKSALTMGRMIEAYLQELGMPGGKFSVLLETVEKFSPTGRDSVHFAFSANPGEELRPLAKVASGGELSRVALAIKTVCSRNDGAQVMVFDEIDAGVGGHTARKVAENIARVAWQKQVLCITHLPQIASMADRHIHIEKKPVGERTQTFVRVLPEPERLNELARMIGGDPITKAGLENAAEMVRTAAEFKQAMHQARDKSLKK